MELSSFSKLIENKGELCQTGNNLPVPLQNSNNIWFIKSGSIDIFSVRNSENGSKGARNYLFTVSSGNILIGLDTDESVSGNLLALGNTDTCLYKLRTDDLICEVQNNNLISIFSSLIDSWILSLTAGAARDCNLKYDLAIEASKNISIPENQRIRAHKGLFWIKVINRCITFLDTEIDEFDGQIYFPLTENSWCLAARSFQTETASTAELIQNQTFMHHLKYFQRQILLLEELNTRMQMVDDFVRNKEKTLIMQQIDQAGFNNLAGILNENVKTPQEFTATDSLMYACRILCSHIGIPLVEPQKDKRNTEINIDDISRSSKFQYRKISLNENWWNSDSGPLLAFMKDTGDPAALISDLFGNYKIIIPPEKTETKLTPDIARRLDEYAYSFYKPFPYEKITPIKFIKFILNSCRKEIWLMLAAGSIGGLLTVLVPLLTGIIVDTVIPQSDRYKLFGFGLAVIFSVLAIIFAQIIRSIGYLRLDTKLDYLIHSALWDRLINLPVSFFKKFSSGELAVKANSLVYFKQILTYSVINIVIYDLFMIFNLLLLFYYSLLLGFLSLLLFSVYSLVIYKVGLKIKIKSKALIQQENSITSLINQVLNSIAKIRIAGVEKLAFKLWTDKYSVKQKHNISVKYNSKKVLVLNSVFPAFAIIFILYLHLIPPYWQFH